MDQAYYSGIPADDSSWNAPEAFTTFFGTLAPNAAVSFSGDDLAFWSVETPVTDRRQGGGSPGSVSRRTVILPPRERPKEETVPNHALTIAMMLALYLDSE